MRASDDVLGAFFVAEPATEIFADRTGPDSRIRKTGFGKRGLENGIRKKKRDSKKGDSENGIRKIYVEKSAVRLSVCLAEQGRGQGRATGQGPNKEYKIRKNKTYKTSQWPKVTGTHGGLHSGLRPRAPTSI